MKEINDVQKEDFVYVDESGIDPKMHKA